MAWAIPILLALMIVAWCASIVTRHRAPSRAVVALGALLATSHALGLWA